MSAYKGRRRSPLFNALMGAVVVVSLFAIFVPLLWLVLSSLSTRADLLAVPPRWIPERLTLQNYRDILLPGAKASEVSRTFKTTIANSFLVAGSVTVVCLAIGSMAAYALARFKLKRRDSISYAILGVRMIPEISLVIPLYMVAARLGMLNTHWVLIVTYLSFALPFAIWALKAFFETVPVELEEAALIDGCSRMGTLTKVILPVVTPGLVSTGLFTFLIAWDEFFFALIFTSTIEAKTVPVAIAEFTGRYAVDITSMMAGGVLAALPPVLLAVVFQRYIVAGLSAGAVKG